MTGWPEGDRSDRLLALIVDRLVEAGLVRRRGRIRTDSPHVLAAVRLLNWGELGLERVFWLRMNGSSGSDVRSSGPAVNESIGSISVR